MFATYLSNLPDLVIMIKLEQVSSSKKALMPQGLGLPEINHGQQLKQLG